MKSSLCSNGTDDELPPLACIVVVGSFITEADSLKPLEELNIVKAAPLSNVTDDDLPPTARIVVGLS